MNNPVKHRLIVLWLSLLCVALPAYGKSADSNAPINIEADAVEMREAEGISIYTGNVRISRGSIEFTGEKITITSQAGRLQQIEIEASPPPSISSMSRTKIYVHRGCTCATWLQMTPWN